MSDPYQEYRDEFDIDTNTFNVSLEYQTDDNTGSPMNTVVLSYSQIFEGDDVDDNQQSRTINSMDTGIPRTHWHSEADTGDYLLDRHSQDAMEEEEEEEEELELDSVGIGQEVGEDDNDDNDDDDDPYGVHMDDQVSGEHMEMDSGDNGDRSMDDNEKETYAMQIYHSTHPDMDQKGGREIGEHEARWAVSTYRPDWGVEKLRDNNPLTYWQSDCQNPRSPHTVDIYFRRATFIKQISIFYDFYQDESYSPKSISIRGGTTYRDLHEVAKITCEETVGWKNVDLSSITGPFRVFQLQIAILSTYMNGKDVHIRQIKVYSVPLPYLQKTNETDGESKIHPIKYKGLR